jgi:uncharacterized membrane protein
MVPDGCDPGLPEKSRRRATMSRKRIMVWVLVVLTLTVLAAAGAIVAVHASGKAPAAETARAREIMKRSDEELLSLRSEGARIDRSVSTMIPDIPYLTAAQYQMTRCNICASIEEAKDALKQVRQNYADIYDLNGVDEYIEYARVKLALIHMDFQQLKAVEEYLDFVTSALAERDAGKPLNSQCITDATNATIAKMKELSSQVEKLTSQAEKMKREQAL